MNATEKGIFEQFEFWRRAQIPKPLVKGDNIYVVIGCGTSYNLALSIASLLTANGHVSLGVPAGEWLSRPQNYIPHSSMKKVVVIALSRSGTTTETLEAARTSRANNQHVIGITCEPGSALATASDLAIEFETHPSEGIVMTASASLMLLAGFALAGHSVDQQLFDNAQNMLKTFDAISHDRYSGRTHFVFLGGGSNYGVALEGALKLQEMAICFTQGFHPGEYRHGPISLVDEKTAIVMLYNPETFELEEKLAKELCAMGALVIGLGGPGDITVPNKHQDSRVAAEVLPTLQLLGERYAAANGIDTLTPRHLTKVVVLDQ